MPKEFNDPASEGIHFSLRLVGITGAAIRAIGSSLIDDVVVPVVGLIYGRVVSSKLDCVLGNPNGVPVSAFAGLGAAMSNIGLFTNAVVNSPVSPLVCFSSSRALTV